MTSSARPSPTARDSAKIPASLDAQFLHVSIVRKESSSPSSRRDRAAPSRPPRPGRRPAASQEKPRRRIPKACIAAEAPPSASAGRRRKRRSTCCFLPPEAYPGESAPGRRKSAGPQRVPEGMSLCPSTTTAPSHYTPSPPLLSRPDYPAERVPKQQTAGRLLRRRRKSRGAGANREHAAVAESGTRAPEDTNYLRPSRMEQDLIVSRARANPRPQGARGSRRGDRSGLLPQPHGPQTGPRPTISSAAILDDPVKVSSREASPEEESTGEPPPPQRSTPHQKQTREAMEEREST